MPSAINTWCASLSVAFIVRQYHMYKETRSRSKIPNTNPRRSIRPVGNKRAKSGFTTDPLSISPCLLPREEQLTEFALYLYRITRSVLSIKLAIWIEPCARSRIRDACSFHVDIIPFILFHPFEQLSRFLCHSIHVSAYNEVFGDYLYFNA